MLKLFLFTAVLALLMYGAGKTELAVYLHDTWPYMLVFYFLQSAAILLVQRIVLKGEKQNFVLFVIGSISFRLISSLLVAIAYLLLAGHRNMHFILLFFTFYLLFLGFELFTLMTNLRSNFETRSFNEGRN